MGEHKLNLSQEVRLHKRDKVNAVKLVKGRKHVSYLEPNDSVSKQAQKQGYSKRKEKQGVWDRKMITKAERRVKDV